MQDLYGEKLTEAMQLLSKRSEMINGDASDTEYNRVAELMVDLTANMSSALPEQRAIASKLVIMGLDGIDKAEASLSARKVGAAAIMSAYNKADKFDDWLELNDFKSLQLILNKANEDQKKVIKSLSESDKLFTIFLPVRTFWNEKKQKIDNIYPVLLNHIIPGKKLMISDLDEGVNNNIEFASGVTGSLNVRKGTYSYHTVNNRMVVESDIEVGGNMVIHVIKTAF